MRRLFTTIVLASLQYTGQAFGQTNQTGQQLQNIFNPRITVFGNATLRVDDRPVTLEEDPDIRIDDRFNLRETEIDFRAAVDPFADAILIAAFESEIPGEFEPGIEEGYVTIKALPWIDRMPLGLRFKVGRFRGDFGQINLLHTHDLPQTSRPLVVQTLLGEEGAILDGGAVYVTGPTFSDRLVLDAVLETVNGGTLPYSDDDRSPAFLGRLQAFLQPTSTHTLVVGASSHRGRMEGEGAVATTGVDLLYKWKPLRGGESRSFLLGAEAIQAIGHPDQDPRGYYLFSQYQWTPTLYTGVRWDWLSTPEEAISLENPSIVRQLTPYASYYFSEFLRLRASWERTFDRDDTFWLELNFVFGSHPPEPYWVNR